MGNAVNPHSFYSSRREKLLESLFAGEVLKELWQREIYEVDLLHSDIDASGYDIVLELPTGVRHIQLKASTKRKQVIANAKISDKPSGCIVVMIICESTLDFKEFLWFGGTLENPCPNIRHLPKARHTKADSTGVKSKRQDTHQVSAGKFERLESVKFLVDKLIEQ